MANTGFGNFPSLCTRATRQNMSSSNGAAGVILRDYFFEAFVSVSGGVGVSDTLVQTISVTDAIIHTVDAMDTVIHMILVYDTDRAVA